MKNSVLLLFFISSTGFINNVLGLGTEGVINGELGSRDQHKYLAAIFAVQNCLRPSKLIGSGVLVDKRFVISAAHHFVDLTSRGKYKLKPKTFYVHLGSSDLNSELGESLPAETFYLFDYNSTTGQDDMILIQTARPHIVGYSEWEPAYLAREDIRGLKTLEGKVSSHGMHNRQDDIDRKLRFATANIVDTSNCDNIVNEANSQLCIKMNKDNSDRFTGLCTNDGGAPFVVSFENRDYVVGIAGKPKESCDDTEIGSVYTDISYYYVDIVLTITDEALVATQILEQNSRFFSCIL